MGSRLDRMMKQQFQIRSNSTIRVFLTLVAILFCQFIIIPVTASPIVLEQSHHTVTLETYTYDDEVEVSIGVGVDRTGGLSRVLSEKQVRPDHEVLTGVAREAAKTGTGLVDDAARQAKSWLGKDYKVITNKAGDNIFMSKDGLRKMRFDIKNPHGDAPHIHLEIFKNGKWTDAIPGNHRIYPKP